MTQLNIIVDRQVIWCLLLLSPSHGVKLHTIPTAISTLEELLTEVKL